ncbi:unnamed protein product [Brassica rapa]|uniref:Non-specific lipid-transfer protein n=1 Tax=Brassica campestris TaxID=3711 RepID=A0A8D9LML2_BRACM|nr:unnamed protein product [Brassica rapa]
MVSALRFFTCLVLAVCIVASVDAAISCDTVVSSLGPCYFYLRQGGIVPPSCCRGVRNLNGMAQTTPDRQQACKCVQSFTKSVPGLNQNLASGLPGKCGLIFSGSLLKWTKTGRRQSFSCLHTPCWYIQ